ncbi:hypothetical protein A0H81_10813 [Grifola frondosa]|uniref:Uncharacterized protein n=1 Tax=Grifola frondosa TaxID=5627 RepID=A0A1C7LYT5_GRIFR|nr:hypothetical protein A0H81_10813 [Grifola frondosa]
MSLRIKIPKLPAAPSQTPESSHKPPKRSIQRVDSDEGDVTRLDQNHDRQDEPEGVVSRPKRVRTATARSLWREDSKKPDVHVVADAEAEIEVDVDVEGDGDDARFLPPPQYTASTSSSPAGASKSASKRRSSEPNKPRTKADRRSTSRANKTSGKRTRRPVVWTDDEDEEYNEQEAPHADDNDDDFTPEPVHSAHRKAGGKTKGVSHGTGARGRGHKDREDKDILMKDERKLPPPSASTAVIEGSSNTAAGSKRAHPLDDSSTKDSRTKIPADVPEERDEPTPPPLAKKRKLPTIKKNKPAIASSTIPSTLLSPVKTAIPAPAGEKKDALGTPASLRKPPTSANNAEINLFDSNVYSELFRGKPGASTPNSGLNRKQKEEERRKELDRMRDEARAKRQEEAKHAFDLQAAPEKIQRFEEMLRVRRSMARYPNILGASFKEFQERAWSSERERMARPYAVWRVYFPILGSHGN